MKKKMFCKKAVDSIKKNLWLWICQQSEMRILSLFYPMFTFLFSKCMQIAHAWDNALIAYLNIFIKCVIQNIVM